MCIQAIPEKDAAKFPFNPFDLTKVGPTRTTPLVEVGMMELNRNPENYFAEVEQAAFNPANIVPAIGFSPDKMLQGRLFSYGDAQRYRLGVTTSTSRSTRLAARSTAITATARCGSTAHTAARSATNPTATASGSSNLTSPNPPLSLEGAADHWKLSPGRRRLLLAARLLFRLMTAEKQQVLFENTARAMGDAPTQVKLRHIGNCMKADPAYGEGVAKALGIPAGELAVKT